MIRYFLYLYIKFTQFTILNSQLTMSTTILSLIILTCLVIIAILFKALISAKSRVTSLSIDHAATTARADETLRQLTIANNEIQQLRSRLQQCDIKLSRLNENIRFVEQEKQRMAQEAELRFKNLANEILTANSRSFKEENESRLAEILTPLRENIEQFRKTVSDTYSEEARQRFSLEERIKELITLNQSIGKEAKDLTSALKGNSKVQGDWGEMILEGILEKSGLQKGIEYTIQQTTDAAGHTLRNESGNLLRPDIVINYPNGRHIVIDSKVSLNAYVNYINSENADEQKLFAQQHLASINNHIKELKNKKYQDHIGNNTTDFVMMFIPNEAAYITAMQLDRDLWQKAYDQRVLIVSPTQLISALRLVSQLWSHDRQTKNAIEIANAGGRMYDKLVGFIDEMSKIKKSLDQSLDSYNLAMNKLSEGRGNLISQAEKMRDLGAKASKQLPQNT